jgi:hypothetical protein
MLAKQSPQELSQVKLVLERDARVGQFRGLVYIFWGLILAKCFLAEWAVVAYRMPFNSLYVWVPTMIFAGVCTWVYAGVALKEPATRPITGQFVSAVWGGCLMACVLLSTIAFGAADFSIYLLPAMFSVVIGVGYFIHSVVDHSFVYKMSAYGWWAGAVGMSLQATVNNLAWFAVMILVLQTAPATWLYTRNRIHGPRESGSV